jgi:hypothetical protein
LARQTAADRIGYWLRVPRKLQPVRVESLRN